MIQEIREFIKENETKTAIEKTIVVISQSNLADKFRDDLIILTAMLNEIEQRDLRGISNFNEINLEKNKINNKLLNLLNELELKSTITTENQSLLEDSILQPTFEVYKNIEDAKNRIKEECYNSNDIKILSNKGLEFIGLDSSIISIDDFSKYKNLQRIKIILLSPDSRWINRGFMALRRYESLDTFKKELKASHQIAEYAIRDFAKKMKIQNSGSGIKYNKGEPYFRMLMTENKVFVSSYAENPSTQVRDLPVYVFKNEFGTLYGALRRHFNDLWKWNSELGEYMSNLFEPEVSAGGILVHKCEKDSFVALVMNDDGSWILPKGHKNKSDASLEQSALREVSEEIGIPTKRLRVIKKIDSYSYDETAEKLGSRKVVHFFLIEYLDDDLPELSTDPDHVQAKWWNLRSELPFMFYNYQKILLSEVIQNEFSIAIEINQR